MAHATEHRCTEGGWKLGGTKDCTACKALKPAIPAKRAHEG